MVGQLCSTWNLNVSIFRFCYSLENTIALKVHNSGSPWWVDFENVHVTRWETQYRCENYLTHIQRFSYKLGFLRCAHRVLLQNLGVNLIQHREPAPSAREFLPCKVIWHRPRAVAMPPSPARSHTPWATTNPPSIAVASDMNAMIPVCDLVGWWTCGGGKSKQMRLCGLG